jgi:hypothetical protein
MIESRRRGKKPGVCEKGEGGSEIAATRGWLNRQKKTTTTDTHEAKGRGEISAAFAVRVRGGRAGVCLGGVGYRVCVYAYVGRGVCIYVHG